MIRNSSVAYWLAALFLIGAGTSVAHADVDTALIVSVDVSSSVDERRYQLQMGGIAGALQDKHVVDAILSGPHASILFTMLAWTDKPKVVVPWTRIANARMQR